MYTLVCNANSILFGAKYLSERFMFANSTTYVRVLSIVIYFTEIKKNTTLLFISSIWRDFVQCVEVASPYINQTMLHWLASISMHMCVDALAFPSAHCTEPWAIRSDHCHLGLVQSGNTYHTEKGDINYFYAWVICNYK